MPIAFRPLSRVDQSGPYAIVLDYRYADLSSTHPNIHFSTLDWFDALSQPLSENAVAALLSKASAGIVIGADIVRLAFAVDRLPLISVGVRSQSGPAVGRNLAPCTFLREHSDGNISVNGQKRANACLFFDCGW